MKLFYNKKQFHGKEKKEARRKKKEIDGKKY